jgi:hypothetical protein
MKKFRFIESSRAIKVMNNIIKNEDLTVTVRKFVDALGDSKIEVSGSKEDVEAFKQVFEMVY